MCEVFFTTSVHHKIPVEEERAQNYTRALWTVRLESRVQVEDANDQNCLKYNQFRIGSCFADLLSTFLLNFAWFLYLSFLPPVGGHRSSNLSLLQLKTSRGYLCSTRALSSHLLKLETATRDALSCIRLYAWLLCFVKYCKQLTLCGCTLYLCSYSYLPCKEALQLNL